MDKPKFDAEKFADDAVEVLGIFADHDCDCECSRANKDSDNACKSPDECGCDPCKAFVVLRKHGLRGL